MSVIVDPGKEVDKLIAEFPGNLDLQVRLGVRKKGQIPFESVTEIPFKGSLLEILRTILDLMEQYEVSDEDDTAKRNVIEKARDLRRFMAKLVFLKRILSKGVPVPNVSADELKIYREMLLPMFEKRLKNLTEAIGQEIEVHLRDFDALEFDL